MGIRKMKRTLNFIRLLVAGLVMLAVVTPIAALALVASGGVVAIAFPVLFIAACWHESKNETHIQTDTLHHSE